MKKLLFIPMILALLTGCQEESQEQSTDNQTSDGSIQIVATTSHAKDLLDQVGGELIEVTGLMGPGVDPHEYEPTASDVEAMNQADAVVYNGLHLEAMFTDVFEQLDQSGTPTFVLADALDSDDYLQADEDQMEYDPHIWFSVDNWSQVAEEAANFLADLDPDNAQTYKENAETYQLELAELDTYIENELAQIPEESRYLITAHDAFQYFADDYDFEVVGVQGLNTQTEAGTADISRLADLIVDKGIGAVFVESSVSTRNIEALIEAAKAQGHDLDLGGELYSDALGSAEEGTDTYIDMYKANIDTIVEGLAD